MHRTRRAKTWHLKPSRATACADRRGWWPHHRFQFGTHWVGCETSLVTVPVWTLNAETFAVVEGGRLSMLVRVLHRASAVVFVLDRLAIHNAVWQAKDQSVSCDARMKSGSKGDILTRWEDWDRSKKFGAARHCCVSCVRAFVTCRLLVVRSPPSQVANMLKGSRSRTRELDGRESPRRCVVRAPSPGRREAMCLEC